MTQELLINVTSAEIRAALMNDGALIDLIVERRERGSVVGNIYLGRVDRVINAMEAAFVNVGLQRSGFLRLDGGRRRDGADDVPIHEGEIIMVQVVKDAIGGKGVQLSRRLTLPGRFLVYVPLQDRVMVSRQIEEETERNRLINLMSELVEGGEGFIVRTAAVGASAEELESDRNRLRDTWTGIVESQEGSKVPFCLHADLDPLLRVLRDYALENIDTVQIDDGVASEAARQFCTKAIPRMSDVIRLHTGPQQLFDQYGIEEEIERVCSHRVDLISGGSLIIESTEALTSIDVNSGKFDNASDLEQMAYRTNREAAVEAARQIRVRNISGLIVVDFIHMDDEIKWDEIIELLENAARKDRNPTRILDVTEAGLVEITRRRRREPLLQTMTEVCAACDGQGRRKSAAAISIEILRALQRESMSMPPGEIILYAREEIIDSLEKGFDEMLAGIEEDTGRTIILRPDDEYHREVFDIVVE
tara:strand:+ start:2160 stop:3590 length:1431 start_codon:yes stop_codon:yes gene_type:complete